MTEGADEQRVSYDQFASFEKVYLEDSYVLEVHTTERRVKIVVEAALLAGHRLYEPPESGEQHCYRRAVISFESIATARWVRTDFRAFSDPVSEPDFGNIDSFWLAAGVYHIAGEWGELSVTGGHPTLRFGTEHALLL